jgi:peptide/nickel transport system permease protein
VIRYVARRLLLVIPTLIGVSMLTFALMRLAPGDAASLRYAGDPNRPSTADAEAAIAQFRAEHLLDRSLVVQYLHYVGPFNLGANGHTWFGGSGADPWNGLLALDLGHEYLRPSVSIAGEIGRRLAVTIPLALIAALLSYLLAIPIGIAAAVRRGGAFDATSGALLFALYALPTFWVGLMLQLALGSNGLGLLPVLGLHGRDIGDASSSAYAIDVVKHSVLPIACLTYGGLAYISRQMRVSMLDALGSDYVRTARAKGLPERTVVLKHALRNSLIPVTTLLGQVLPALVGGSIVVETVFDVPGIGLYAYEGLLHREYNVVMACVLLSALMTVLGFLMSDVLYAWIDPRIRHE